MKLMPASRALATIRDEVASSVGPPNIMVPRQIGEIFRPLRPSWRYCMAWVLQVWPSLRGALATKQSILSLRGEMDCFAPRNDGMVRLVLQYLKHARGHCDTTLVDGDFGG